jgi:hypothetical protein
MKGKGREMMGQKQIVNGNKKKRMKMKHFRL